MQSFFKKRAHSPSSHSEPKRLRTEDGTPLELSPSPRRIACWNCNGLSVRLRCEADNAALRAFLRTEKPDIFFLSEVRLPAAHNAGIGKPSGTTIMYRSRIRNSDTASRTDFGLVDKLLNCAECSHYKTYFTLADSKYAGTAMFVNTKTTALPTSVRFNLLGLDVKRTVHDPHGRVIYAKFKDFSILHTYVPNNGWAEDHFERRRAWDEAILSFMERKKDAGVKIMWIGDLNVAPTDDDLSHASYFRRQTGGRDKRRKSVGTTSISDENIGQPGCTDAERNRFAKTLEKGELIDAFRAKLIDAEHANIFSWRGPPTGKLGDKGMRIDHCIVSCSLLSRVDSVTILGADGPARPGFMGSDHSPLLILCNSGDGDVNGAADGVAMSGVAMSAAVQDLETVSENSKMDDISDSQGSIQT